MRYAAGAVLAAAAALLAGCSLRADDEEARRDRIFELSTYTHPQHFEASALRAIDPKTLLPIGRPLRLGDAVMSRVLSPDRRTFAFGAYNFGDVILVDPATMERRSIPLTKGDRVVTVLSWPRRNLLLAETCVFAGKHGCFDERLWLADPVSRRARSVRVPGFSDSAYDPKTRRTVVLVAGFRGGIRSSRLLVVDAGGRVRRIGLRIPAGVEARGRLGPHYVRPSLILDSRRGIAIVIGPRQPVAELDLRTVRIRYRAVAGLDPLETAIARDAPREWTGTHNPYSESERDATLLEPGLVQVWIRESRLTARSAVRELARAVVVDTLRWRVRKVWPREVGTRAGDLTLVNARRANDKTFPPFRLIAYDAAGNVRYRLDGAPQRLFTWRLGAGLLYAGDMSGTMTHVFDPATGKLLRRIPPRYLDFNLEPAAFRWTRPDG